MTSDVLRLFGGLCCVCVVACVPEGPIPRLSPQAERVRVESSEPPTGARLISTIEATAGRGCGIDADRGSLKGATVALKEAAARRGMNFVRVTRETKPYSGHDCMHGEYTLSGLGYRVGEVAVPSCVPPCAPGYACRAGSCQPACDPACAPEQMCRADRVCVNVTR